MTLRGLKEARLPEQLRLKTELRDIDTLEALGRQARIHSAAQVREIANSISRFGFISPVMIDDRGRVLVGMGRLAAAKLLGLKQVPVLVVGHLTAEEERLYVLADNRLAEKAGWDMEIVGLELAELQGGA